MTNVLSGNPLVLDTVGDVYDTISQQRQRTYIAHIEYIDYAVDTEVFELQDCEGRIVWRGSGNADFSPVVSQHIGFVKGLVVDTLVAPGRLLVYLKP